VTAGQPPRLHVVVGPGGVGRWHDVVSKAAALVGLDPVVEPLPARANGGDWAQRVLAAAAGMDGAVLVLPHAVPPTETGTTVRRVLVPFDRSEAELPVLRPLIRRALEQELAVQQIHELRRSYQVGTANLRVRSGRPGTVLRSLAADADLIVACWNGRAAATRAEVLREILSGAPSPLLLIRTSSARSGAGHG
jgi:hypothetical protein